MKYLKFASGFIYNLASLLFESIPMSIKAGEICTKENKFIWDISEEDFLKGLGEE